MAGLDKYNKIFQEHLDRFDSYVQGKPVKLPDPHTSSGIDLLAPLIAVQDQLQELIVSQPPIVVPVSAGAIDFDAILQEVKADIVDNYGEFRNVELSPDNSFMVWAHAKKRALQSEISVIDEALEWNAWLKPICDAAFLYVVGDEPVRCGCKTCKQSAEELPCYDGQAPQTLAKCEEIKHVLRKLEIPYGAGLYMVADERKLIEARAALNVLKDSGYQLQPKDTWMRRAWTCGELAPGVVERLT